MPTSSPHCPPLADTAPPEPRFDHMQTVRTSSSYLLHDFGPALPPRRRRLVTPAMRRFARSVLFRVALSGGLLAVLKVGAYAIWGVA